jgi:anti-sigma factor RsiW
MNETALKEWVEIAARRPLSAEEQGCLAALLRTDPALAAAWEEEIRLNGCLRRLPDAPVSSNFTALVLAQVARETAQERPRATVWPWRVWLRSREVGWQVGLAGLVLVVGLATYRQHQLRSRAEMLSQIAALSELANSPGMEALADFVPIRTLAASAAADRELLDALR